MLTFETLAPALVKNIHIFQRICIELNFVKVNRLKIVNSKRPKNVMNNLVRLAVDMAKIKTNRNGPNGHSGQIVQKLVASAVKKEREHVKDQLIQALAALDKGLNLKAATLENALSPILTLLSLGFDFQLEA